MRIFGIGIDVVEIGRIAKSIERHGDPFLAKVFTTAEREYCDAKKFPAQHYAARFAAKEAVSKAFGTGIGQHIGWLDMEVRRLASGQPYVVLHDRGEALFREREATHLHLTLSHTQTYATAVALLERV